MNKLVQLKIVYFFKLVQLHLLPNVRIISH